MHYECPSIGTCFNDLLGILHEITIRHIRYKVHATNDNPCRTDVRQGLGAQDRTRTCTLSLALVPETSVSTNSTTWAWLVERFRILSSLTVCKYRKISSTDALCSENL